MQGPNLSQPPFVLHLDDQSKVKRGGTERLNEQKAFCTQGARGTTCQSTQLVKKSVNKTHTSLQCFTNVIQCNKCSIYRENYCRCVFLTTLTRSSSSFLEAHVQFVTEQPVDARCTFRHPAGFELGPGLGIKWLGL